MIVLLDEMFKPEIAQRLRDLDHDVISVHERVDLMGATDATVYSSMQAEGRVIVTSNHAQFVPLVQMAITVGEETRGIILTADRSLPRSHAGAPILVSALDRYLAVHAGDRAVPGAIAWLAPAD